MSWWLIILVIVVVYIAYIMLTGKGRRDKILKQIISESYFLSRGEELYLDNVIHFEAVKKFVEENGGWVSRSGKFATVDITLEGEDIYTEFTNYPISNRIEVVSIGKEEKKKPRSLDELFGPLD